MNLKESIVDEACYLIKKGGWYEFNFDTIAAKLQTTRSNIHYHFSTKEGLANEVLESFIRGYKIRINTVFEMTGHNFPETIMKIEESMFNQWQQDSSQGFCACTPFLTDSNTVPKSLRDSAKNYSIRQISYWANLISISQRKGYVDSTSSAESLAKHFVMLFSGFRSLANISKPVKSSPFKSVMSDWAASLKPREFR